jgi:hypothetical protein
VRRLGRVYVVRRAEEVLVDKSTNGRLRPNFLLFRSPNVVFTRPIDPENVNGGTHVALYPATSATVLFPINFILSDTVPPRSFLIQRCIVVLLGDALSNKWQDVEKKLNFA